MTYEQILESYTFPHRFLVQYACSCAREVAHLNLDPTVINAITTAEAWLEGKATEQDCQDAANDASVNAASAASAAYATYAAYAANAAIFAAANAASVNAASVNAVAAANAANAARATYHAIKCKVKGKDEEYFTKLLLTMIQTHLSSFEREMIGL